MRRGALAFPLFVLSYGAPVTSTHGQSAVALPKLERTAQGYALGDAAAFLEGLNALGVNPAGLRVRQAEFLSQYQQMPLQTDLALAAASYPLRPLDTTIAVSYLALRSANFDRRDERGVSSGRFSTQDQMIGLHASRPFGPGRRSVLLGLSVKLLRMQIDERHADALAVDAGGRYQLNRFPLTLGLSALNLGRGPTLAQQESKLPARYVFSAAYPLGVGLSVLGSVTHMADEGSQEFSMGLQYWVGGLFALRGRYFMARETAGQGTGMQSLAGGAGFHLLGRHTLDYAFQPYESRLRQAGAAGTHRVTLTLRFAAQPPGGAGEGRASLAADAAPGEEAARTAGELAQDGLSLLRRGRFSGAEHRLQQASDADPSDRQLADMLQRARQVAAVMGRAESHEGTSPTVRRGVIAFVERRDLKGSVHLLRKALNQAPEDGPILAVLNVVEKEAGMELTEPLGGEAPDRSLADRKLRLARDATYDGHYDLALTRARDALELEPKNAQALELMGSVYYLMGDKERARQSWEKALELNPHDQRLSAILSTVPGYGRNAP